MIDLGVSLHLILTNAYALFSLALAIWAIFFYITNRPMDGAYFGSVAIHSFLAVAIFILTILLTLGGKPPIRWVYWLYIIYCMIVLPATYSLLKGRDDRQAASAYIVVCVFTFLTTITRAELTYANPAPL
jgi:hypothetical protein